MKKYEYMRLSESWGKPILMETINEQAKQGWRLVQAFIKNDRENPNFPLLEYLFERELEEVPDELEKEMD